MRAITAATLPCRAGSGYSPVPLDGLDRAHALDDPTWLLPPP
jgi:hypothetical protein